MKKMMMFGAALLFALLCGCRTQIVTLDVIPSDARVIANGVAYDNKSPIFIETRTGKQLAITAYKEGYRDKIHIIDYELSGVGKAEAWTSFLVLPAFGLLFDSAWTLKENNLTMVLEPLTEEAKQEMLRSTGHLAPAMLNGRPCMDRTQDPNAEKIFNQL